MFFLTYLLSTRFVLYSVSVKMLQYWCLLVSVQYSQTLWILDGLFACRHVYQFSKVFVGEQTLSRSASSSVLCASSRVAATTASTTLPSHTCLVADRVMSPNVPASSPSESAPVVLSRVLVRSPSSSPVTCHESSLSSPAGLPDIASADKVRSMQELPSEPESSATDTCGRLQDSQVKCFLNHVNQGYKNPSISSWSTVRNCLIPNVAYKCSTMSPGSTFILVSKVKVTSHKTLSVWVVALLWVLASSNLICLSFGRLFDRVNLIKPVSNICLCVRTSIHTHSSFFLMWSLRLVLAKYSDP